MEHNILCTIGEGFAADGKAILATIGPTHYETPVQEDLPQLLSDITILVTQLGLVIDRAATDAAKKLRIIATATTGLDHIDSEYARAKGITILSLQGETSFLASISSTAELAWGLVIALMRKIPPASSSVLRGQWQRERFRGRCLEGKTLGIIGYGRLGKMMARYAGAANMRVLFTDPAVPGGVPLDELLRTADVLSLHVPLTEQTEGMIGASALSAMKPNTVLINTSRGKIVDEAALIESLEAGALAGYAADVVSDELSFRPDRAQSALIEYARTHDTVLLTPHIGGTTVEAREATDIFIARKLQAFLSHGTTSP